MTRYVVGRVGGGIVSGSLTVTTEPPVIVRYDPKDPPRAVFRRVGMNAMFDMKRGVLVEWVDRWTIVGARVVARELTDDVAADVDAIDARIAEADAEAAELRREKQALLEAALPRLKVARVPK